eukprot:Hpha_TRINITY_DN16328_c2_g1::TRINITY_DN16328_c2_g1_i2::g.61594::m.61594
MQKFALAALMLAGGASAANIVVAGDSWGSEGKAEMQDMLKAHSPNTTLQSVAVSGSTAAQWSGGKYLKNLQGALKADTTHVWLTIGGNDAIDGPLGTCQSKQKKSAAECTSEMLVSIKGNITAIIDAIHTEAPKVRVLGFGYDLMGMDKLPICPLMSKELFPACKNAPEGFTTCWNTQFIRIQAMWEDLSKQYAFVDTVSMLGTLQAASGDAKAATGSPDLSKFSPNSLMQINCIHPTRGKSGGFDIVFEKQWDLYWSKQL